MVALPLSSLASPLMPASFSRAGPERMRCWRAFAVFFAVVLSVCVRLTEAQADLSVTTVQRATADGQTRSLTFLSSGYTSEDRFLADARVCVGALMNNSAGIIADPWPRYMPLINAYAVYQRSADPGASRPHGPLHSCAWMSRCDGPTVNNNLDCSFGTPNPHLMSCNVNKVVALAALAPAQDVVVVLVNDTDPAGVATSGVAYITTGSTFMAYMLVHYLNRAIADLHEEYNMGFAEKLASSAEYVTPNCATSSSSAEERWSYWFSTGSGSSVSGSSLVPFQTQLKAHRADPASALVDVAGSNVSRSSVGSVAAATWRALTSFLPPALERASLGEGCSFSNYVAPTSHGCLMRNSSLNFMCPVCREQLARSFFFEGVDNSVLLTPSRAPVNLLAGRCPQDGLTVYVDVTDGSGSDDGTDLFLSVGSALEQNDMEITWLNSSNHVLAVNTSRLRVSSDVLQDWSFPATVRAVVKDNCPYVRPSLRTDVFTATATFRVARRTAGTVCLSPVPTCLVDASASSGVTDSSSSATVASCVAASTASAVAPTLQSERHSERTGRDPTNTRSSAPQRDSVAVAQSTLEAVDIMGSPKTSVDKKNVVVVAACVSGGVAVILLTIVFVVHTQVMRRRPRELLNELLTDRAIFFSVVCCCLANLVIAVLLLVFAAAYLPWPFFKGLQLMVAAVVLGAVLYLAAVTNLCAALFRWYPVCMFCCVLNFLLGLGFFAIGILALWAHLNQEYPGLSRLAQTAWESTIRRGSSGSDYVCALEFHLKCSGYIAGCFMTNSSACPSNCGANLYVNACQVPLLTFIGKRYLPLGVLAVVGGFFFVLTAMLDALYFMRFRQLSRTGRLRRRYRKDPRAPIVPITYHECKVVNHFFLRACEAPEQTLRGSAAVRFLRTVFGQEMSAEEMKDIAERGPMTFDELMAAYFPYVGSFSSDPRMLTPDEADEARNMTDLQRKQYTKLQAYARASGALSPARLHEIFKAYTAKRFLPQTSELLNIIREEASKSPDTAMCRGLSPMELEGLRAAWVALHPDVTGVLTDVEIRVFYEWSHGAPLPRGADDSDGAAFQAWREKLAVRQKGVVDWGEFCYPYAQRALLREARRFLETEEKEVPPEMVSRRSTVGKYGSTVADKCFLPYEQEIPIERLMAYLLHSKTEELDSVTSTGICPPVIGDRSSSTATLVRDDVMKHSSTKRRPKSSLTDAQPMVETVPVGEVHLSSPHTEATVEPTAP